MTLVSKDRQRKTKDPCKDCFLHKDLCLCSQIPKLDLRTKVTLVIHAKELKRTTNTGRLALKALSNSEMYVRGDAKSEQEKSALDLTCLLSDQFETLLFYPSKDAIELTSEYVRQIQKPIQLIVPDGNWRQASKVHHRHSELKNIPRVMIKTPNLATQHLRAENTPEGMSTLQAIAYALAVIEGVDVGAALEALYKLKLSRTIIGRGIK